MPEEPIVGAEAMHRTMVGWLVDEGPVEKDGEGAKPDGRG
jgi:hypothetical protein